MTAPLVIPFNFQPVATGALASGTYTVTANRYAWVTVTCQDGGSATLNGTEVIASQTDSVSGNGVSAVEEGGSGTISSGGGTETLYTVPAGDHFRGQIWTKSTNSSGGDVDIQHRISGSTFDEYTLANSATEYKYFGGVFIGEADSFQINSTDGDLDYEWGLTGVLYSDSLIGDSTRATSNTISFWAMAGDDVVITGNSNLVYSEYNELS